MMVCRKGHMWLTPVAVGLLFFCLFLTAGAEQDLEKMRADQLVKEADYLLNAGEVDSAIPYLDRYLEKMKDVNDQRVRAMKQDIRFKLAKIFIKEQSNNRALGYLDDYVAGRPVPLWHEAMKLQVIGLLEVRDFTNCVTAATNALAGPPADIREALEKAALAAAAEEDPDAYELNKYGELIVKDDDGEIEEPAEEHPSGYGLEDLVVLNMTLGQAYSELGMMEESLEPYSFVVKYMKDPIRKGFAIMQVVNGLVEKRDFKSLLTWVPELYRTDARFDIRVNMALINAATALFDAKEYDSALPLFRMILPRNELIAHQSVRLRELQIEAGIISPEPEGVDDDSRLSAKDTLFGRSYGVEEETFVERGEETEIEKPAELIELEQLIETIKTMPPYENEAIYRNAYLYDEVNRPWESVRFFDLVFQDDPSSELAKRSFYELIRILLNKLGELEEAETRGLEWLAKEKEGIVPRQITYLLSGYYQQNRMPKKVKSLMPVLEGFVPDDSKGIRRYECELYYMQAIADLVLFQFEKARDGFRLVLERFPGSHQQENATYWHAMTLLYLQNFEEALPEFEAYLKKYPEGTWVASALFQSGTCQFGMEHYPESKILFTEVIEKHPESPVWPDACNLRGDLFGSEGLLDKAIADYASAFAKAHNPVQAKYSTFQMARVYEAESRYDEILRVVNIYLDAYGEDADIAEGIFWIGKTLVNQGKIDEAVESYFNAIVQYGTDVEATGVDSMIDGLVRLAKKRVKKPQREELKAELMAVQTDSQTLSLRLRAMVAQIDGTQVELGQTLIGELETLTNAAPPVLAAICDASFANKDYSRAEEILNTFLMEFDESEFMRPAFKLRGYDLFAAGEYEETLKLIEDVQGRYGTDYDVAWAQIMKGRCLSALGGHDKAMEELAAVMNVSNWRGAPFAEAVYRMAEAEESVGNLLKAHSWYQRTYFQYKGYAKGRWAADAYLGSARCLKKLGYEKEAHNTYRGMLFNKYVNHLPQVSVARDAIGPEQAREVAEMIASGVVTNFTTTLKVKEAE